MRDVFRPTDELAGVDLLTLATNARPTLSFDTHDGRVVWAGMFVDRSTGLEAEHRDEKVVFGHEHFPFDSDAALERQRAPLSARERLDPQFQTLTSR